MYRCADVILLVVLRDGANSLVLGEPCIDVLMVFLLAVLRDGATSLDLGEPCIDVLMLFYWLCFKRAPIAWFSVSSVSTCKCYLASRVPRGRQ